MIASAAISQGSSSAIGPGGLDYPSSVPASWNVNDAEVPFGELSLQRIWERQRFDRRNLLTTTGEPIDILSPGRIQDHSGPDLEGARLRIGGQVWMGNIEVHLRSSEWDQHGHQDDPAYDNVILHVVLEHDREVITSSGFRPPTMELKGRIKVAHMDAAGHAKKKSALIPCAGHLMNGHVNDQGSWIRELAVERVERRSRQIVELFRSTGRDAHSTIHLALFRAYGMGVNAIPFEMLARSVPNEVLWRYQDDVMSMEALLFGQAGLLPKDPIDPYPRELQKEHAHLARLHGLHPLHRHVWKFGRMRPANFPHLRIAQLSSALIQCQGSYSNLLQVSDMPHACELLQAVPSIYWDTHHVFDERCRVRKARMGRGSVESIVINALVPTLHGLGTMFGNEVWIRRAFELLDQVPAESNQMIRDWSDLGLFAGSATMSQGLIQLRKEYCSNHRCLSCRIGRDLLDPL